MQSDNLHTMNILCIQTDEKLARNIRGSAAARLPQKVTHSKDVSLLGAGSSPFSSQDIT